MRAGVYTRISLDRTGEGAGVERQDEDCRRLIEQRGWTLASTFQDNSISAAGKRTRPAFEALLAAVGRGDLDVVVAWQLDRLTRNRRDEGRLIDACRAAGTSLAVVRGTGDLDLSTAIGRAIAEFMSTWARLENEQKSERQRRAFAQQRADGRPWGPIPAFGYADDRTTVIKAEARMLRDAYAAVLAGASCRGIARDWNAEGSVSRTGKPWSGASVKRVLINPRYAGIRGTTVGAGNRRDLIEVGPAAWAAIITEDVWRASRALLTDPARRSTDVRARVHLLPGIARCGRCGAPMRSAVTHRGKTAYACSAERHLSRDAGGLDEFVTAVVLERLARPDIRDLLHRDRAEGEDAAKVRVEAAALRARLDDLAQEFSSGEIDSARELRAIRENLNARLAQLKERMARPSQDRVLADLPDGPDVAAWWDALDLDRRRAVISLLMTVVVLPAPRGPGFDPNSIRVEWSTDAAP
ncbi:MAG: recombinase family protein [Pseudonocardia sp.]